MCIYCPKSPYKAPINYNPDINSLNYDKALAKKIHQACKILNSYNNYYIYYGELNGFNWYHLPSRLWASVLRPGSKEMHEIITGKIRDVFNYILNINTDEVLDTFAWEGLYNTTFTSSPGLIIPYTYFANKVIQKYNKEDYPELFELAHRILHERPMHVEINGAKVLNISEHVKGSVYAATTVWNKT